MMNEAQQQLGLFPSRQPRGLNDIEVHHGADGSYTAIVFFNVGPLADLEVRAIGASAADAIAHAREYADSCALALFGTPVSMALLVERCSVVSCVGWGVDL